MSAPNLGFARNPERVRENLGAARRFLMCKLLAWSVLAHARFTIPPTAQPHSIAKDVSELEQQQPQRWSRTTSPASFGRESRRPCWSQSALRASVLGLVDCPHRCPRRADDARTSKPYACGVPFELSGARPISRPTTRRQRPRSFLRAGRRHSQTRVARVHSRQLPNE